MEKEIKDEKGTEFRKKRIVSIFRRRKKSDIRPFIREKNQKKFKKIFLYFFLFIILIFCLAGLLLLLRVIIIPKVFELKNTVILSPLDKSTLQNSEIEKIIKESGLDVSDILFTDLTISFMFHRDTKVFLSSEKDIKNQLNLLVSIEDQMTFDNKRAISIDLRYNKPIVKF